jgi:uncharacterized iron-regulated membrane protein
MIKETHKRMYDWHSKGGIYVSIALIFLCLTAVPIIFKHELEQYVVSSNTLLGDASFQQVSVDELIDMGVSQLELHDKEFFVTPASEYSPMILWHYEGGDYSAYIPVNGKMVEQVQLHAVDTIAHAHYDFLLPAPYGEYIVGLVGLLTFALVIIGTLMHVKWRKQAVTYRKERSFRLWASDLHKLAGLWLLPFHLVISYTGAVLGLGGLLIIITALSSFNGDQEAAIEAVLGKEPVFSGQLCEQIPSSELLAKAEKHWRDKYGAEETLNFELHYPGDCNANFGVASAIPGYLLLSNYISYSAVTGEEEGNIDWIDGSFGERWYATLGPLHFGHFAGNIGKWVFAISSMLMVVMVVTGLVLWIDKQQATPLATKSEYFYSSPLLKFIVALTFGVANTTLTMLLAAKVYPNFVLLVHPHLAYVGLMIAFMLPVYVMPKRKTLWFYTTAMIMALLVLADISIGGVERLMNGVNLGLMVLSLSCVVLTALKSRSTKRESQLALDVH